MKSSEKRKTTKSFKQLCIETAAIISFTKKMLSAALVLCCSSLDFFVLQTFFETMPREAIKRKSRGLHRLLTSTCVLDSLAVEVLELCPLSSNFVRLAIVVF